MTNRLTTIERAFQLARSGLHPSLALVLRQLKIEHFMLNQIEGPILKQQLRELCIATAPSGSKARR